MNAVQQRSSKNRKNLTLMSTALIACLAFLGMGGLVGGVSFLVDPSGAMLGVSPDILASLPVSDFAWAGLFLFLVMGIFPFVIALGIWERPRWAWTDPFTRWTHEHWSWAAAVALGLVLVLWLGWQVVLFGYQAQIQVVTGIVGIVMLALCFLPSVRKDLAIPRWTK